ncbi:MAG: hypothetical protein CMF41_02220, partial [Legionellales bacterium]
EAKVEKDQSDEPAHRENSFLDNPSGFSRWSPLMNYLSAQHTDARSSAYELIVKVYDNLKKTKPKLNESKYYIAKRVVRSKYMQQLHMSFLRETSDFLKLFLLKKDFYKHMVTWDPTLLNKDDSDLMSYYFVPFIAFASRFSAKAEIFKNFYNTFEKKSNALNGYELGLLFTYLYQNNFQFKEGFWIDNLEFIELFLERFISFLPEDPEQAAELLNLSDQEKTFIYSLCGLSFKIFKLISTRLSTIFDSERFYNELDHQLRAISSAEKIFSSPESKEIIHEQNHYHAFGTYKNALLNVCLDISRSQSNLTLMQQRLDYYCNQLDLMCRSIKTLTGGQSQFICRAFSYSKEMCGVSSFGLGNHLGRTECEEIMNTKLSSSLKMQTLLERFWKNFNKNGHSDLERLMVGARICKNVILEKLNVEQAPNYIICKMKNGVCVDFSFEITLMMMKVSKEPSTYENKEFYLKHNLEELLSYFSFFDTRLRGTYACIQEIGENITLMCERIVGLFHDIDLLESQRILCRYAFKELVVSRKIDQYTIINALKECGYPCEALVIAGFDRYELSRHYEMKHIRDAEKKLNLEPMHQTITESCRIS